MSRQTWKGQERPFPFAFSHLLTAGPRTTFLTHSPVCIDRLSERLLSRLVQLAAVFPPAFRVQRPEDPLLDDPREEPWLLGSRQATQGTH